MFTSVPSRVVTLCICFLTYTATAHAKSVAPAVNQEQALGEALKSPVVAYVRPYNTPCYADYVPTPEEASGEIAVSLAANEREPVQIGVYVPSGGKTAKRVAIHVDIDLPHEVGYLYHHLHSTAWRPIDNGQWYTDYPGGRRTMPRYIVPAAQVPTIEPGYSAGFWVTLKPSKKAKPGLHRGNVVVLVDGKEAKRFSLTVNVHPFTLPRPKPAFGLYYRPDRIPSYWTKEYQLKYAKDMAAHGLNMGQISGFFGTFGSEDYLKTGRVPIPQTSGQWIDPWTDHLDPNEYEDGNVDPERLVETQIETFVKGGLANRDVPLITVQDNYFCDNKQAVADKFRQMSIENDWPEVMFQTRDEPPYFLTGDGNVDATSLKAMLDFKKVKNVRMFTALSGPSAFAWGQLHDVWIVLGGHITPEMVREAKRQNAEIWSYSERLRFTNFRANRFYLGLYMWGLELQGNTSYCYAHYVQQPPAGQGSKDPVWVPGSGRPSFDHINGYALPGPDGPIPGMGFVGMREGIDDYRYLQLLEARLEADGGKSKIASEATRWLDGLKKIIIEAAHKGIFAAGYEYLWELDWDEPCDEFEPEDYDAIRDKAASYIAQLDEAPGEQNLPPKQRQFPVSGWEGEPFEHKSVAECAKALAGGSTAEKRAAALALTFKEVSDADTSAVVDGLAKAIQDPETRMPAFVAIRTLGPKAASAKSVILEQLDAEDAYVRCGALLALDSIGPSAVVEIASALDDRFPMISAMAAECLARMGADAAEALPALKMAANSPPEADNSSAEAVAGTMRSTIEEIEKALN